MEIQLRSEKTGLSIVATLKEAYEKVQRDPTIWKVSFTIGNHTYRLVYDASIRKWENRPLNIISHNPWVSQDAQPIPSPLRQELIENGFSI